MSSTISTRLQLLLERATPEQRAQVEDSLEGKEAGGVLGMLKRIHDSIASKHAEVAELRSAKQRLEKMLAEGLFGFTQKVDPTSFKVLVTVLAEGDIAKASRKLGMGDSTVRDMLREWKKKGGVYRVLLDLVAWRKKTGRKKTVALSNSILLGQTNKVDHPALLSDVLDGLLDMTEDNWREQCEELKETLRPVVRRE